MRTGWLVGCDGGHSAVRRLAGIDFPGTDPELTGYQAVVDIADPEKLADGWTWSTEGAYRYGPQPGRVATVEFDDPPADRSAPITLEELQTSLRRVSGTDVTLTALRATPTRWTDNTRQAATYKSGRVLLAGDAAHVHPPFGGQGLNLGVGDAMNLGWKLGAVLAGWAPAGLLDTYDAERRPVGAWVLDWTRAQIGVLRGDAKSAALRKVVGDLLSTTGWHDLRGQEDLRCHAAHRPARRSPSGRPVRPRPVVRRRLPPGRPRSRGWVPAARPHAGRSVRPSCRGLGRAGAQRAGPFPRCFARPGSFPRRFARPGSFPRRFARSPVASLAPVVLVRPDGVVAWATDGADATDTTDIAGLEAALLGAGAIVTPSLFAGECA